MLHNLHMSTNTEGNKADTYPIRLRLTKEQRKALKQAALDRDISVVTLLSDLVKDFLLDEQKTT